uniref:metallophosphoesterase n=1 Tax=Eubacterium cellulosolvens TaxID=29322 RepID=UPI000A92229D|nr:metallophosphoesterase [[Eubacterium] cellulosolvens]
MRMVWTIVMIVVLLVMTVGTVYMTRAVGRFAWIRRAGGEKRWRRRILSLLILVTGFCLALFLTSLLNAIVIYLHFLGYFLLFGLLMRLIRKLSGKTFRVYWQGWLAITASLLTLGAGYYLCTNVWKTEYHLTTGQLEGNLKLAFFADSHIGATFDGEGFVRELKEIEAQKPDLLLIAGDFVDDFTTREDMYTACEALGKADFPLGVWYSYGNHDTGNYVGKKFSDGELKTALSDNGIHVLEDECELVDGRFYVAGRLDYSLEPRKDMDELLAGIDRDKYVIVMDHQPNDYDAEADSDADLVVSGHTHGGQMIPFTKAGELTHSYERAYGYERRKNTDFIVTSGIADWVLLFKTGTKSEYVIVNVQGKN